MKKSGVVPDGLYQVPLGKGIYRRHLFAFGGCVMVCGDCGCPVTAERQKGYVYYHCTQSRGVCMQRAWTREEVEYRLHQIMIALHTYSGDNGDVLPLVNWDGGHSLGDGKAHRGWLYLPDLAATGTNIFHVEHRHPRSYTRCISLLIRRVRAEIRANQPDFSPVAPRKPVV